MIIGPPSLPHEFIHAMWLGSSLWAALVGRWGRVGDWGREGERRALLSPPPPPHVPNGQRELLAG